MTANELERYIRENFSHVEKDINFGYTFFFVGSDHRLPFVTIAKSDNDYDSVSALHRDGIYRINIGVSKASFDTLFPKANQEATPWDYTALNVFMPHPEYAKQHFICILNPEGEPLAQTREYIAEAYQIADRRPKPSDKSQAHRN